MSADGRRVLVVLTSLAAEGTPRLVLELCRIWRRDGISPVVAVLRAEPDDLAPEFDALGIERVCLHLGDRGYARYGRLALQLFRLACRDRFWLPFIAPVPRTPFETPCSSTTSHVC